MGTVYKVHEVKRQKVSSDSIIYSFLWDPSLIPELAVERYLIPLPPTGEISDHDGNNHGGLLMSSHSALEEETMWRLLLFKQTRMRLGEWTDQTISFTSIGNLSFCYISDSPNCLMYKCHEMVHNKIATNPISMSYL